MKSPLKKLGNLGHAHVGLVALVLIVGFGIFGAYKIVATNANAKNKASQSSIVADQSCQTDQKAKGVQANTPCPEESSADLSNQAIKDPIQTETCKVGSRCMTPTQVKAMCTAQHKVYNQNKNECKNECVSGYTMANGICQPKVTQTDQCDSNARCMTPAQVEAACAAQNKLYNKNKNECKNECVSGYTMVDGVCQAKVQTDDCKTGSRCMTPAQVKAVCAAQHKVYNDKKNTCKEECISGYQLVGTTCVVIASCDPAVTNCLPPEQVQAECAAKHLEYNPDKNKCKSDCIDGYKMSNGVCHPAEEVSGTMRLEICRRLGRVWLGPVGDGVASAGTNFPSYYCSTRCIDPTTSTYVSTGDPMTSYCKANAPGSTGADPKLSKEECNAQHRIYMNEAELCSARCQGGYYLKDGVCTETKAHAAEAANSACGEGTLPNNDGSCPDDEQNDQQAPNAQTVAVELGINQKECDLLGREWVPAGKDSEGNKVKGGCSVESCNKKDAKLRKANGSYYCTGYVLRIDEASCKDLNRKWIDEVGACAADPQQDDKKAGARDPNSDKCSPPHTTYVYRQDQPDLCMKPSVVDRLKSVAKATGTPFVKLTSMSKAGVCNLQPKKHWNGHACVRDRVIQSSSITLEESGINTPGGPTTYLTCEDYNKKFNDNKNCPTIDYKNGAAATWIFTCKPSSLKAAAVTRNDFYTYVCS